jgi:exo-poly-alpha-galacturonosidase
MHMLSTGGCKDVTLNNVKVMTYDCNNGDGIDFSGQNLIVANSYFDTGDDAVNFDAGMGLKAASKPPVSGIWVFNTYFAHGHGAVVCGSHTGSWIQDVVAEDNVMENTEIGLRCKTGQGVGGGARNITFRNNILKTMKHQAFIFTTAYTDANAVGGFEPAEAGQFRDIIIENCNVDTTIGPAIEVDGIEEMPHKNITFRNVHFTNVQPNKIQYLENGVFDHVTYDGAADQK